MSPVRLHGRAARLLAALAALAGLAGVACVSPLPMVAGDLPGGGARQAVTVTANPVAPQARRPGAQPDDARPLQQAPRPSPQPPPAAFSTAPQSADPLVPHRSRPAPPPAPAVPATLTFDDCGTAPQIATILDQLDRLHLHAVFFPTGLCRDQYPWLVPTLEMRGHTVCNHTFSHPNLLRLSDAAIAGQIAGGVHTSCTHVRPPYGAWDGPGGRVARIARAQGYDLMMWDVDSGDYTGASAALITARIRSTAGVVLLHMHGAHTGQALAQL